MNSKDNMSARFSLDHARRVFYDNMRDKFPVGIIGDQRCQDWVNSLVLTQGFIRVEVQLNTVNNIYTFGVNENQQNTNGILFNTERRLPLQDTMVATSVWMYVGNPADEKDTEWQLRTYGNQVDFSAAAANALNTTFYSHGRFNMRVNNRVVVPARQIKDFWYRGQTQQTAPLGVGSPDDMICGATDGGATSEPNILLIGSANNVPTIELPTSLSAADAFQRAVLVFEGPYAQNSTVVN